MNTHWLEILITALISVLMLLVEHWGPWQRMFRKQFHAVVNYILGVLAIVLPLTWLLIQWDNIMAVTAMWVVTITGGLAVVGAYALDGWIRTRAAADVAEHEAAILRPGVSNDARTDQ